MALQKRGPERLLQPEQPRMSRESGAGISSLPPLLRCAPLYAFSTPRDCCGATLARHPCGAYRAWRASRGAPTETGHPGGGFSSEIQREIEPDGARLTHRHDPLVREPNDLLRCIHGALVEHVGAINRTRPALCLHSEPEVRQRIGMRNVERLLDAQLLAVTYHLLEPLANIPPISVYESLRT